MSAESALIAALQANAGVAALVSTRVFIAGGRQGADYPYVTIQRISTEGAAYLDGPSTLEWPRFQIDCWSPVGLTALAVSEAIRVAIDGVSNSGAGLSFVATFQDQRGPAPDEETRNFRVSQDYFLYYGR